MPTLADIKAYLGISGNDQDIKLQLILDYVVAFIKADYGIISASDFDEIYNGDGTKVIVLKYYPVNTISEIKYIESDYILLESDYILDQNNGILYLNIVTPRGYGNISIKYNAGYTDEDMPGDIKMAIYQLCEYEYLYASKSNISSERVDDIQIVYKNNYSTRPGISILEKYKKTYI